ncbi:MAG: GNAT family N-acetyltransferase [Spirochaetaceae bacterium]|nr:GNAT family N-acetyltransferase [Spirochaetaceae bacterium]
MAATGELELRTHPPYLSEDRGEIAAFLLARGLEPPADEADYAVSFLRGGAMVGSGSRKGRILRGIAVDEAERGGGLAARIVSELEAEASRRGVGGLFVFTKPDNRAIFESLGYRELAAARGAAVLLEKGGGLDAWLASLRAELGPASGPPESGPVAALVMNCNPFTLGHRHLVATAASRSSRVILFVVSEEASSFPFEVRRRLVREGVADFPNVRVVAGSDYLVSRATFPTYFLKDRAGEAAEIHARLDADLFGRRIAPALGVARRYVAEEPYSPVTATYNRALAEVLPPLGVELVEIPRLALGGAAVSASAVRRAIREGRLDAARSLVPESTWNYLASPEAAPVLARVAAAEGRH